MDPNDPSDWLGRRRALVSSGSRWRHLWDMDMVGVQCWGSLDSCRSILAMIFVLSLILVHVVVVIMNLILVHVLVLIFVLVLLLYESD